MTRTVIPLRARPANALALALFSTSTGVLERVQDGRTTTTDPLTRLAKHLRDLCGKSVDEYRNQCGERARDILLRSYSAVYTPGRRKGFTDTAIRSNLLKRADDLENVATTSEARQSNIALMAFCELVYVAGREVRDEVVLFADAAN